MTSEAEQPDTGNTAPKQGRDLTAGSIPRHLIAFAWPMFVGSLLQTLYSVINGYWVGRYLSTRALAVITVSFPAMFLLMTLAFGVTMAASILVSQAYGAKDWPKLRRVVQNATMLTIVVAGVCLAVGFIYIERILIEMKTSSDIMPMALGYMRIFLWMLPSVFGVFLLASMLRGTGDSFTPLIFQGSGLVLTAVLDPILMFGWLGFPRFGVNGTAIATVFANAATLFSLLLYLRAKRHVIAPDWRHLRADLQTSWLMVKIGGPSMFQNLMLSTGLTVITGLVNTFGVNATAAFGAAIRIDNFAFLPALTTGMAVATLAGQNIGARKLDRVKEVFQWGLILGGGLTLAASVVMVTAPESLMGKLSSDPNVIRLGVQYLRIVPLSYVLLAVLFVSNGVINGAGHTFFTTFTTFIALWLVRVPLAYHLAYRLHRLEGIWYAMVVGFAAGMLVSLAYYFSGLWKRPVTRAFLRSSNEPADEELAVSSPVLPCSESTSPASPE